MATGKNHRVVKTGFANKSEFHTVEYDFAKDGGTAQAYDLLTFESVMIIKHVHVQVIEACTSAGSATAIVGVTGNTNRFMNATQGAVASLTLAAVIMPLAVEGTPNVVAVPLKVAAADKLLLTIATAALTAGRIRVTVELITP